MTTILPHALPAAVPVFVKLHCPLPKPFIVHSLAMFGAPHPMAQRAAAIKTILLMSFPSWLSGRCAPALSSEDANPVTGQEMTHRARASENRSRPKREEQATGGGVVVDSG